MDILFSILFTIICKPGIIQCSNNNIQYILTGESEFYYKYKSVDIPTGEYLYFSNNDTITFYVQQFNVDVFHCWNKEFEIFKQ